MCWKEWIITTSPHLAKGPENRDKNAEACPVLCSEYWRKFAVVFLLTWQLYSATLFGLQAFKLKWGGGIINVVLHVSSNPICSLWNYFTGIARTWICKMLKGFAVSRNMAFLMSGGQMNSGERQSWLIMQISWLVKPVGKLLLQILWWWLFQYAVTCCKFWREF